MPTDTDITLLNPQQAMANISRDELVNLLVDDALDRAQDEMKALNAVANREGARAKELLLAAYQDARKDALRDLEPILRAFNDAFKLAGSKSRTAVFNLPEKPSANGYQVSSLEYSSRSSTPLDDHNLCKVVSGHAFRAFFGTGEVEMTFYVAIGLTDKGAPSDGLYVVVPCSIHQPLNLTEWVAAYRAEQEAMRRHRELAEAIKDPEKLRRKALANLTREALSQGGVTLQGGLPARPLALPNLT